MKLNLKQKKILKLLAINCRFTLKDIAKAVGTSKDTVRYQIQKLVEEEKFGFFNTQFVHPNVGYTSTHHWVKLSTNFPIETLKKLPNVNSINSSYGKYNYQILSLTKNKKQLQETIRAIKKLKPLQYKNADLSGQLKRFTNIVPTIDVSIKIPSNKKKVEYELNEEQYAKPNLNFKIKLDEKDKKIVATLLKNPRATFQEISQQTGINHETIKYRIKRYIKNRFINNFGLVPNFHKYGLYNSYFLFKVDKLEKENLIKYLENQKKIYYSPQLSGDYDGMIYVLSKNPEELGKIYNEISLLLDKNLKELDLIFWDKTLKYIQFPIELLK